MKLIKGTLTAETAAHGAELISLRDDGGTEYIWQGDPAYWAGRNPVLFPIVGSLRGGAVQAGGRTCRMGRHGFARGRDFTLTAHGGDFAAYTLREDAQTLRAYPFPFALEVRHTLRGDGFTTAFTVRNTGTAPMPFCIGAHTAFRCPLRPGERFEDYRLVFERAESAPALPLSEEGLLAAVPPRVRLEGDTLPLSYGVFDREDTLIFDGLRSESVSLVHGGSGRGVRVSFGGFPMLAFWTAPHKRAPYLCVEPWHGCAAEEGESGAFEDKRHRVLLAPGSSKTLSYTVTILQAISQNNV